MKQWYRIELKTHGFWLAAEDRTTLATLLEEKGHTEIESIKEDPEFPECLNKKNEKKEMSLPPRSTDPSEGD